jgi:hypothetical protein
MRKFVPYISALIIFVINAYFLVDSFGYLSKSPGAWICVPLIAVLGGLVFVAYKMLPPKPQLLLRRNIYLPLFLASTACCVALVATDVYFLWLWLQTGRSTIDDNQLVGFAAVNAFTFGIAYLAWREWRADCRAFKESEETPNGSTSRQL